jgi:hypothetical protein
MWSDSQWTVLFGGHEGFEGAEQKRRPEGWRNKTWMLHRDNAPAHTSLLVHEFLAKHETIVVPQPPYSPDLVPANFFSFFVPKVEIHSERSLISDDRRNRRKFATGPTCYPAKRVPGRVSELEKPFEAVYRHWRGGF